jgi:hypothetical protein
MVDFYEYGFSWRQMADPQAVIMQSGCLVVAGSLVQPITSVATNASADPPVSTDKPFQVRLRRDLGSGSEWLSNRDWHAGCGR